MDVLVVSPGFVHHNGKLQLYQQADMILSVHNTVSSIYQEGDEDMMPYTYYVLQRLPAETSMQRAVHTLQ